MEKLRYLFILLSVVTACTESDKLMYDDQLSTIYFAWSGKDTNVIRQGDTLIYTFAFEPKEITTYRLSIPLQISGKRMEYDRSYRIAIGDGKQAALPNVHYEVLEERQNFAGHQGNDSLIVLLKRGDQILENDYRDIEIRLLASEDFQLGPLERQYICIRFSDQLEKPGWWDSWSAYFGPYHRIKYQEWIRIWGNKGDISKYKPMNFLSPQVFLKIFELKNYFITNPHFTEDNEQITIPIML